MNALWIGSTWPEHRKSAAGVRARQLIDWLAGAGWDVTVSSTARETDATQDLRASGRSCERIVLNDPSFDAFLLERRPDLVVFDRFMIEEAFAWRVRQQLPEALRVLDTIDLHGLREFRRTQFEAGEPVDLEAIPSTGSETWLRELAAIHRSDLALLVSEAEVRILERAGMAASQIAHLPLAAERLADPAPFTKRRGFVSIGNFRHPPNVDSVAELVRLWPALREALPEATMHLYGAFPPKAVMDEHAPDTGFHVHGQVGDAHTALAQHRVLLAPLRFGAGLKGKILDAWSTGTPVVATPVGAEGMGYDGRFGGVVAASDEAFIEAAVRLDQNEKAWQAAQRDAEFILERAFDPEAVRAAFLNQINAAVTQKIPRRESNRTGAMLWMQTLRSTEYFARYLEEKSKRR